MLTQKQYRLLTFIEERLRHSGVSPSFDEMREAVGLKSKSGVHRLIYELEERGFIRHLRYRARALEVIKMPAIETQTKKEPISMSSRQHLTANDECVIPLYGKIAAGTPIEAIRDMETNIPIPSQMLGRGEHYALTIEGDSMINAGILNGDTVIIKRADTAENGTIVVALVDGFEATLKRIRRKGSSVALEAENPNYPPRILSADRVQVQGILVGLLRNY